VSPNLAALSEKWGDYVPVAGPEIAAKGEELRKAQAAELKHPEKVATAKALEAQEAQRVAEANVGAFRRWLPTLPGMGTMKDGKLTFAPQDENMARDILAAEEIARTKGTDEAKAHYQTRQEARPYLASKGVKDIDGLLNYSAQNSVLWANLKEATQKYQTGKRKPVQPEPENPLYVPNILKSGIQRGLSAGAYPDLVP
jgi:hypothetical protein